MRICNNHTFNTICTAAIEKRKEIALTLFVVAALATYTLGVLQYGSIISVGLLGYQGAFFISSGVVCTIAALALIALAIKNRSELVQKVKKLSDADIDVSQLTGEIIQAIQNLDLDPNNCEQTRAEINAILKALFEIKKTVTKGHKTHPLAVAVKQIKAAALSYYFATKLTRQKAQLTHVRACLNTIISSTDQKVKQVFSEEKTQFLTNQLDRWQAKLDKGQPVSLPKYYHCTKSYDIISSIVSSEILVKDEVFRGAFVSNHPETTYGPFGLILGEEIETSATKNRGKSSPVYPMLTRHLAPEKVCYADPVNNATDLTDKQDGVNFWLGFQRPIPIQRANKQRNPLSYDDNTTLSYLFYQQESHSFLNVPSNVTNIKTLANDLKIPCLSFTEAQIITHLFHIAFPLCLPSDWKGKLYDKNQVLIPFTA